MQMSILYNFKNTCIYLKICLLLSTLFILFYLLQKLIKIKIKIFNYLKACYFDLKIGHMVHRVRLVKSVRLDIGAIQF